MTKKPAYPKLTPEILDKFLNDLCEKRKREPKWTFATGKQGYIEFQSAVWRSSKMSEKDIEEKIQHLQDTLEDRIYIVTA